VAQVEECRTSKHKAVSSNSSAAKKKLRNRSWQLFHPLKPPFNKRRGSIQAAMRCTWSELRWQARAGICQGLIWMCSEHFTSPRQSTLGSSSKSTIPTKGHKRDTFHRDSKPALQEPRSPKGMFLSLHLANARQLGGR
jgi:hypothetical protein